MFVVDLLRDLRRRQVLRQQDGKWIVAEDLAALKKAMPESVRSLVQRKIDALDDSDRRLLAAASVQGVDFDTAVLSAVLEQPEEEIEDRLERLEREHALVRFVDEKEAANGRSRSSIASRIRSITTLRCSLRATRRAALSRAIAQQLSRAARGSVRLRRGHCPAPRVGRQNVHAAEYWNQAAQAGRGYMRTTRPSGSPAVAYASRVRTRFSAEAAAELGLR